MACPRRSIGPTLAGPSPFACERLDLRPTEGRAVRPWANAEPGGTFR